MAKDKPKLVRPKNGGEGPRQGDPRTVTVLDQYTPAMDHLLPRILDCGDEVFIEVRTVSGYGMFNIASIKGGVCTTIPHKGEPAVSMDSSWYIIHSYDRMVGLIMQAKALLVSKRRSTAEAEECSPPDIMAVPPAGFDG